ncbi:MAG: tRNA (N6-isopentenyl adenosine(37)-C2)-methylthiotransferase MiaB [Phycisphaerales bacterium]|nr:tRNA (N6-isopentenyl adenosine(37)-C2)-methylthiotransferase MiaB [Phycisphaerales bacterium]
MPTKRVYLETMGCQMNVLDSELVIGQLCALGYKPTDDYHTADLVLINTCSVRHRAEEKAYSRLTAIARAKTERPNMIIGVIGCMVERDHEGIRQRCPYVDLLCGPGNLNEIPALLATVEETRVQAIALEHDHSRRLPSAERTLLYNSIEELDMSRRTPPDGRTLQAYVRVQRGCDKFCSFCVVPFTRGPERNRPPANIVIEARRLVDMGAKEITLLGQTINSYAYTDSSTGRTVRLADLLEQVHEIEGLQRLRFVTSYPGDFTDDILQAMRDLPKVCEYLHLPAQSGSNAVLKRMRRRYTAEQYTELIARARETVPGISLAGDFIVGFCGETDAEHAETLALIERVGYKNIYMFKYSPRPATVADRSLPDDVPEAVKKRRHLDLVEYQKRSGLAHHQGFIGRTVEILVEGFSKAAIKAQEAEQERNNHVSWKRGDQLVGRTRTDEIVVFTGPKSMIGQLVTVWITAATALTLHGEADQTSAPATVVD